MKKIYRTYEPVTAKMKLMSTPEINIGDRIVYDTDRQGGYEMHEVIEKEDGGKGLKLIDDFYRQQDRENNLDDSGVMSNVPAEEFEEAVKDDEDEEVPVATEEQEAKRRRVAGGKKATKRATKRKATKRKTHNKRKTMKAMKRGKK
jgi:hypothetical protein